MSDTFPQIVLIRSQSAEGWQRVDWGAFTYSLRTPFVLKIDRRSENVATTELLPVTE